MSAHLLPILSDEEIKQKGATSDIRYFHTTHGENYGYNERARRYHRSYGLVTNVTHHAFQDIQLGDLATAPLYRRDHLGFRVDLHDRPFTWQTGAAQLNKNQRHFQCEQPLPAIPPSEPIQVTFPPQPKPSSRAEYDEKQSVPASLAATTSSSHVQAAAATASNTQPRFNVPPMPNPDTFEPTPLSTLLAPISPAGPQEGDRYVKAGQRAVLYRQKYGQ